MRTLKDGWNGYSAPAPSRAALVNARSFLTTLMSVTYEPSRVSPSAVGGVGISHKKNGRRVYVEFFNDGAVFALFSDRQSEPISKQVIPADQTYRR